MSTDPDRDPADRVDSDDVARVEAEALRRRAQAERAPHADGSRNPQRFADLTDRIAGLVADRPHAPTGGDGGDPEVWDDLTEHQARVRAQAWRNCLVEADHKDYIGWTLDQLDELQNPRILRGYVDGLAEWNPPVLNLILPGRVGAGKTAAAVAVGTAAVERHGLLTRLVKHSTYLAWLRPDGAPHGLTPWRIRHRHRTAQLLILDDLGAELDGEATEFVRGETTDLLGDRLTAGRPTVVTTNLDRDRMETVLRERTVSRLGGRAHVATVRGPDRRRPVRW